MRTTCGGGGFYVARGSNQFTALTFITTRNTRPSNGGADAFSKTKMITSQGWQWIREREGRW